MNKLPCVRINIAAMIDRIANSDIYIRLCIINNLIHYVKKGAIPPGDLIELEKGITLLITESITCHITSIKEEKELFSFAKFINTLYSFKMIRNMEDIVSRLNDQLVEIYNNNL